MNKPYSYLLILAVFSLLSCKTEIPDYRQSIDLSGEWKFALDTGKIGESEKWFEKELADVVQLPGTTDENQKGYFNADSSTLHLHRRYKYEGMAWYQKAVQVPENMADKYIELFFERSRFSKVWVDGKYIGDSKLLQSPQKYDVSEYMTPGSHVITVMVNNDLKLTPYGNVHIYSDDTQTNWNGILGKMQLEASAKTRITNLQVYPDIVNQKIDLSLEMNNPSALNEVEITLFIEKTLNGQTTQLKESKSTQKVLNKLELTYELGNESSLWDEYEQPLYNLTAVISSGDIKDSKTVLFGMRSFEVNGKQFSINGRKTFLRGKHEAAVFPLTGYPPMEVDEWRRVYQIAKSYGINHYRFHSYCPPESAFTAADIEGIYLEAELPFWGGLDSDTTAMTLRDEGFAMLDAYANHPSFVMFSHGNELWSGHDRAEANMAALKAYDGRPLYSFGSNNTIGYIQPSESSEFFVGARVPENGHILLGHTRLTHAFADVDEGATLNSQTPSTMFNFDYAVEHMAVPIISHEIGQYQIYPNYDEIDKYTGVLQARNLEIFRDRLEKTGMSDMDSIFQKASGAWSALCYKAEMEAAIGTKDFGGFQLLDLQDFPGQGTALVGVLDAFMDSKEVVSPGVWRQSCNDVVVLLEMPKYVWAKSEKFQGNIKVANYSNQSLEADLTWQVKKENGDVIAEGVFEKANIPNEGLVNIGATPFDFAALTEPTRLNIELAIAGTSYSNSYPIWVYPELEEIENNDEILVTKKLDQSALSQLNQGGKVLFFPKSEDVADNSVPGLFPPDFWNYGMFKKISGWNDKPVSPGTLGLLTNPEHPIFESFPTDFHTNSQWFSIIKASNPLILNETDRGYMPIVQVVDNLERNHKLGLIFEFKVGDGKLLVCMADLPGIQDKPEAANLYQSMVNYMNSNQFDPAYAVTETELKSFLSTK